MEEERIAKALARIEAAARRIESAASKPATSSDPELAQRHERLQAEARAALAEIDSLIGVLEA